MPTDPEITDPFLASLDEQFENIGKAEPWRREALITLLCCHYSETKTPFEAMRAMVLAGHLGIAAPMWAVNLLTATINDRITSPEVKSLDIALGFKGKGKGKTGAAEANQRKIMHERLCLSVHKLVLSGLSKAEACRRVAQQVKRLFSTDGNTSLSLWITSGYSIKPPNADTLSDYYEEWERNRKEVDKIAAAVTPTQKDHDDYNALMKRFINLGECFLANPSEKPDEATLRALKNFLDLFDPPSATSHT